MTDITVALIGALALVAVTLIQTRGTRRRLQRVEENTRATREQVENDHPTNLRVEADERHEQNVLTLATVLREIEGVREGMRQIWAKLDGHTDQIHDLESTQPKPPSRPTTRRRKK